MKDLELIQHIRESLKMLANSIESLFCYTFQLEQVYLLIEDSEVYEGCNQLDKAKESLLKANNILSNYDYSANPF